MGQEAMSDRPHSKEKLKAHRSESRTDQGQRERNSTNAKEDSDCTHCREEHRQLEEWFEAERRQLDDQFEEAEKWYKQQQENLEAQMREEKRRIDAKSKHCSAHCFTSPCHSYNAYCHTPCYCSEINPRY